MVKVLCILFGTMFIPFSILFFWGLSELSLLGCFLGLWVWTWLTSGELTTDGS